jgi:hypothetical protein
MFWFLPSLDDASDHSFTILTYISILNLLDNILSLAMMKEGGKATLVIPSDLAYGDAGSGGAIPPGATLKFEVELFKVNP